MDVHAVIRTFKLELSITPPLNESECRPYVLKPLLDYNYVSRSLSSCNKELKGHFSTKKKRKENRKQQQRLDA